MASEVTSLIEQFIAATGMSATRFGRNAVRDSRFVLDLRLGRAPGLEVQSRAVDYMMSHLASLT